MPLPPRGSPIITTITRDACGSLAGAGRAPKLSPRAAVTLGCPSPDLLLLLIEGWVSGRDYLEEEKLGAMGLMQKGWKDEGLVLHWGGYEQSRLWHCALSTPKSH